MAMCPGEIYVSELRKWYIPVEKTAGDCTICEYCYNTHIKNKSLDQFTVRLTAQSANCDFEDYKHEIKFLKKKIKEKKIKIKSNSNNYLTGYFDTDNLLLKFTNRNSLVSLLSLNKDMHITISKSKLYTQLSEFKEFKPEKRTQYIAKKGYIDLIRMYHKSEIIVDKLLNSAAKTGQLDVIKQLVLWGANPLSRIFNPTNSAMESGHLETIKYFLTLDHKIDLQSLFYVVVHAGHLEPIKHFVSLGCVVNEHMTICANNNIDATIYLLSLRSDNDFNKIMLEATEYNNLKVIKYCVDKGADIYYQDFNIMTCAVGFRYREIIKYLMSLDDKIGYQALLKAIDLKSIYMVKYMVSLGVDSTVDNYRAAQIASGYGFTEIYDYLDSLKPKITAKQKIKKALSNLF